MVSRCGIEDGVDEGGAGWRGWRRNGLDWEGRGRRWWKGEVRGWGRKAGGRATGATGSGGGERAVEKVAGALWSGRVWMETGKAWWKERKRATGAHKQGRGGRT
jgi:hypothetical protein